MYQISGIPAARLLTWVTVIVILGASEEGGTLELLTVHELADHCEYVASEPGGVDGQYCIRYIQGFIDGAVETDHRITQSLDRSSRSRSALAERAWSTRMPGRGSFEHSGKLAGFCLGDPMPLREIIDTIIADLVALDIGDAATSPAREAVEDALRRHYPCGK